MNVLSDRERDICLRLIKEKDMNKKIVIRYVYSWLGEWSMFPIPNYRALPHPKTRVTGNYQEVNGEILVEVDERRLFMWRKRWISECDFTFTEVEEFMCHEYPTDK